MDPKPLPDSKPLRILILTADAGFGHRSAANAVASALSETYGSLCQVDIVNPLDDKRTPTMLRDSQSDYDKIVRNMPELYRFGYDASDASMSGFIIEGALIILLYEVMLDLVHQYQPDAILTAYPMYQAPLTAVFSLNHLAIPLFTVVTDLADVHRLWFHVNVDACMVPTKIVYDQALQFGFPPENVYITGIPVNPQIGKKPADISAARVKLGWQSDLPTFLAVGSRRMDNLIDTLNVLNHFGQPLQLAVVAGKDDELYKMLQTMDWHIPTHLYNFVSDMAPLMHSADGIICKAGGLITTEALACGLPMLLVDALPGQETGNVEYVVANEAGDLAESPMKVLQTFAHWMMNDCRLLKIRTENARRLGKPRAAYEVSDLIVQAAQHKPTRHSRRPFVLRPSIINELVKGTQVIPLHTETPPETTASDQLLIPPKRIIKRKNTTKRTN